MLVVIVLWMRILYFLFVLLAWSSLWFLLRFCLFFLFQAEGGIRVVVRSRGLGELYKRQDIGACATLNAIKEVISFKFRCVFGLCVPIELLR